MVLLCLQWSNMVRVFDYSSSDIGNFQAKVLSYMNQLCCPYYANMQLGSSNRILAYYLSYDKWLSCVIAFAISVVKPFLYSIRYWYSFCVLWNFRWCKYLWPGQHFSFEISLGFNNNSFLFCGIWLYMMCNDFVAISQSLLSAQWLVITSRNLRVWNW